MKQKPESPAHVDPLVFRAIVDQSTDAVIFSDRDGTIRIWNRGAELVFGYSAAEALGRSLDLIIPERLRAAHWEGFRRAVDAGRTKYAGKVMNTRSLHKDGRKLYVELSFGLVDDGAGGLAGVLATGRDCTERYLAEKDLQTKVGELQGRLAGAAANSRVTAWQCIGCGKIDAPATCIGVCQDRKTEFVYGFVYDEAMEELKIAGARAQALGTLVRRLASTTPRAGEWERSYKAFQEQAHKLLEGLGPGDAGKE